MPPVERIVRQPSEFDLVLTGFAPLSLKEHSRSVLTR
jgi:hypothetical protein